MSDNAKLLAHARGLVALLEKPEPGLITWGEAIERSLEGIMAEAGLQALPAARASVKEEGPACPSCGAQPVRFDMQQGPVPTGQPDGSQLLIAQFWCHSCRCSLGMQIMGVIPGGADPAADLGRPKPKLWRPGA